MKKKEKKEMPHPMLHGQHSAHSMKALKEAEGHMEKSKSKKKKKMKHKGK